MYTHVREEPHSESRSYSDTITPQLLSLIESNPVRKLKIVKYPYGHILTNYRLFILYLYILYLCKWYKKRRNKLCLFSYSWFSNRKNLIHVKAWSIQFNLINCSQFSIKSWQTPLAWFQLLQFSFLPALLQ